MLKVLIPVAFVPGPIYMNIDPKSLGFILYPLPFVDIPVDVIEFALAIGSIVFPLSFILRPVCPYLDSVAVSIFADPLSSVDGACRERIRRPEFLVITELSNTVGYFSLGILLVFWEIILFFLFLGVGLALQTYHVLVVVVVLLAVGNLVFLNIVGSLLFIAFVLLYFIQMGVLLRVDVLVHREILRIRNEPYFLIFLLQTSALTIVAH